MVSPADEKGVWWVSKRQTGSTACIKTAYTRSIGGVPA